MIVLDETGADSGGGEGVCPVGFHEVAALVLVAIGLDHEDIGKGGGQEAHENTAQLYPRGAVCISG
jgi:hypothetical protein